MGKVMRAEFIGYNISPRLNSLSVVQKRGRHGLAILEFETSRGQYLMPVENTPVMVRWGVSPARLSTFYGYLNHSDTTTRRDGITRAKAYILGTSKPMNDVTPTTWSKVTRSGIVRDIAKRHNLRTVINPHNFVMDSWASGKDSDFQVMRRLEEEAGYILWVDGSTVYFLDPEKALNSPSRMNIPTFANSMIRNAKVVGGSGAPREEGQSKRRIIYGLDYTDNEFFELQSGPTTSPTQVVDMTALTYDEAKAMSHQRDAYFTIHTKVDGDVRVRPGTLFNLSGGGLTYDQTGRWLAEEVEHHMTWEDFTSTAVGVRNASGDPTLQAPSTVRGSQVVDAVIRNKNRWEAVRQEHLNV